MTVSNDAADVASKASKGSKGSGDGPSGSIPCAVLMCHAPIVVPEVGGARAAGCSATTRAMREAASRLLAHRPEVLVVLSPHTPRQEDAWSVLEGTRLQGDFGDFGAPGIGLDLPVAAETVAAILAAAEDRGHPVRPLSLPRLDHGALVPLHFLAAAGWNGPTVVVGFPWKGRDAAAMGEVLSSAAAASGRRWGLLASGDMSHRLQPGAPAGYHPRAAEFDRAFVERIELGDLRGAAEIDAGLRQAAAEDVVDSVAAAAAAVGWDSTGAEKLCYEGPFGVGYLEAVLHEAPPGKLVDIARDSLGAHVGGGAYTPPSLAPPWDGPRAVFVTLRTPDRNLRGCIGHLQPATPSLAEEVAACAVAAGTRDPRFPPVAHDELPGLSFEISILQPPEPARFEELDPRRYGVLVACDRRRGVLLPDVPSVTSSDIQLEIALQKGGIGRHEPYTLHRFQVLKIL